MTRKTIQRKRVRLKKQPTVKIDLKRLTVSAQTRTSFERFLLLWPGIFQLLKIIIAGVVAYFICRMKQ